MILDQQIVSIKEDCVHAFNSLSQLIKQIKSPDLARQIQDLISGIEDPFMFVIVGEVKAGKSSFINALLATGQEICKTAPSPMTDTIQQILYDKTSREEQINPYLKKVYHPIPILENISIVDTPGTNTIIDHHQEITESFIPSSDLIVFVFESKNPYRQSAWEFFDFIHEEWRRKVLFVLQQKDLMNEDDLKININGVKEYAKKKGINDPNVFAVSALLEDQGKHQESGYLPLRKYITDNITGGKAPLLKLTSSINTAQAIQAKIQKGIALRKEQLDVDRVFMDDINSSIIDQESVSKRQVDVLVENLIAGYNKAALETEQELSDALSFGSVLKRSFGSIWSGSSKKKSWLDDLGNSLEQKLNNELYSRLSTSLNDLSDSIQRMALIIELKLKNHRSVLPLGHEIFSEIAEKRSEVINKLQDSFTQFIRTDDNFKADELLSKYGPVGTNIATGGGLAIIGVIISSLTKVAILDIAGGVLTAVGVVFAGISIGWNKRKIITGYRQAIDSGRDKLENEIKDSLSDYSSTIRNKILDNFSDFESFLDSETNELEKMLALSEQSDTDLSTMVNRIQKKLKD